MDKLLAPRTWHLAALLAAMAASGALAAAAGAVNVSQRDRQFSPAALHIAVGTVVHIVNDDKVTHHVYVNSGGMSFDSGEQPVGTTVDLPFDRGGTFAVRCAIHPTMRLQVTAD
jgi:plastocyanin